MTKRRIGNIGIVFGIIATLMLFVGPIIIEVFFDKYKNDKTIATIYFITFLIFTYIANSLGDKSNRIGTTQEEREDKLKEILGTRDK